MDQITITTMCALINDADEILFIDRIKDWPGLALPGGHVEGSEGISDCIIREINEETGLQILSMDFRGITHFYNQETEERYLVFNFVSHDFRGTANANCNEGKLHWIPKQDLHDCTFAEGMMERFPIFFTDGVKELFIEWTDNGKYVKIVRTDLNS